MPSQSFALPAFQAATIVADAVTTGSIVRVTDSAGDGTSYAPSAIAASSTTVIGPFTSPRNYLLTTDTGVFTLTIAAADATASSAGLASSLSDETGTGSAVFATSPTLVTPTLGVATVTSVNKVAITAPATSATLTIPDGVTLTGPATSGTAATLAGTESLSNKTLTTPVIGAATGTSLAVTGAVTSSGGGIGYATGAGGAVTQLTDATTGVTLNKLSGQITTVSLDHAAGVDFSFTLTNSTIAAGDVVVASIKSYGGSADGIPVVNVQATAAGSCILNVRNTGAVALDALAVINFAVLRAVAA